MGRNKPVKMWVDPDFKKVIKRSAVDKDMSIIDYTGLLASEDFGCVGGEDEKKRKKLKFFV